MVYVLAQELTKWETQVLFRYIGESLFTTFASLAWATQFLMELQIDQFWTLKGHTRINSANEYEPDVLNTFCATRV